MKKLMLLGGSRYLLPVIKTAHELGLFVITCDYLPDNVAHKYSDEYINISIVEKEKILKAAQDKNINGIMSFACDPGVVTAAYVAEKLGLPFQGSYESVCILQDKGKFRRFLQENGFNTPKAKSYTTVEEAKKDIDQFGFPVMVKPTDSAGSKGVQRVNCADKLPDAIENALRYSHSRQFILEEFLEPAGCPSDSECFSVNGQLQFCSFSSQMFDENSVNPYTPAAFIWPSTISEPHQKELTEEIRRLIRLLNLKTGIYNVETRECTNGKAYIMEISPRGGGNRLAEMLNLVTGTDLIRAAVLASIGEEITLESVSYNDVYAEIILHSNQDGIYHSLWLSDEIQNLIIEKNIWIEQGTPIRTFSGAHETIGTLVLKCQNRKIFDEIRNNWTNHIKINMQKRKQIVKLRQL